jgi:serine phosphatase RsbU (regulator of sigma subunit)
MRRMTPTRASGIPAASKGCFITRQITLSARRQSTVIGNSTRNCTNGCQSQVFVIPAQRELSATRSKHPRLFIFPKRCSLFPLRWYRCSLEAPCGKLPCLWYRPISARYFTPKTAARRQRTLSKKGKAHFAKRHGVHAEPVLCRTVQEFPQQCVPYNSVMARVYAEPSIDDYLRKRLMPVEGAIPQVPGIEMYGNSIPVGTVGGDLFEYINFQQRYDIDARTQRALTLSRLFLEVPPPGAPPRNAVDDHVEWLKSKPYFRPEMETEYRAARSSDQLRVAEDLEELRTTAGVLLVDAQGHGIIAAKIASTVHDTFHASMLSELDRYGRTTPELFENINLRLAQSVTARNALGRSEKDNAREIATMLYGEVRPYGYFRFVSFGHPPPLVFSAEYCRFMDVDKARMAQFLALGLQIPEDHPDRKKYFSMQSRKTGVNSSDVAEITLMSPGDILFLYTDGVYDGTDDEERQQLEAVMCGCHREPAKNICNALLDFALTRDDSLRQSDQADRIDDKTVFIVKRG